MKGKLERIDKDWVVGWAWDPDRPDEQLRIELIVNGRRVDGALADRPRGDLRRAGIGGGAHGFRIGLRRDWLAPGENRFVVLAGEQRAPLSPELVVRQVARQPDRKPAASRTPSVTFADIPALDATDAASGDHLAIRLAVTAAQRGVTTVSEVTSAVIRGLFERRQWSAVIVACEVARDAVWESSALLPLYGRALLYAERYEPSVETLERLGEVKWHHGNAYYLGLAHMRLRRWDAALAVFEQCIEADDGRPRYHFEAARARQMLAFGEYGVYPERPELLDGVLSGFDQAFDLGLTDWRLYREYGQLLVALGRGDEALTLAQRGAELNLTQPHAFTAVATLALRLGHVETAVEAAERALELLPENDTTRFNQRFIRQVQRNGGLVSPGAETVAALPTAATPGAVDWTGALRGIDAEWVDLGQTTDPAATAPLVERLGFRWAAGIRDDAGAVSLWRSDFLRSLLAAQVVPHVSTREELVELATRHGRVSGPSTSGEDEAPPRPPVAVLFSLFGIRKFGGAERFLEQMGQLYREAGYEVLVVGMRDEHLGEYGEQDGLRHVMIERTPEAILRTVCEARATVVHAVTGVVYDVLSALRGCDITFIHGVHFWREMFHPETPSPAYYPHVDDTAQPREEFRHAIVDSPGLYVNSKYTQRQLEQSFNVRAPIIYSLPDDTEAPVEGDPGSRNGVLLVNTRSDKGFELMLDVAARLPGKQFRAIASQSRREAAFGLIEQRGLTNVEILEPRDELSELYRAARVVVVPSYRFVETFSRVVIEAHRHGTPVVGSDQGNVPYLLAESGVALPDDVDAWVDTLGRLLDDDAEWSTRSALALENSERYAFRQQRTALNRVVSAATEPLLVGVGSGLGNIVHTTPLLRNLARRLGRPVDVVVAGDHTHLLFVPGHPEYVGRVFGLTDEVFLRRYDTVFLTHSFGDLTPGFASANVLRSRDWDSFRAEHPLHEAEFNLAAAKHLLGVDYDADDVLGYYLGDFRYRRPDVPLVGFHAGSKRGVWDAKRWPHFGELARRLDAHGVPVASFGTPDEFVPGTIDLTGGTIAEMAERMLRCTTFVSNDSGVMNVANALGIPLVALFGPTAARTRGPLGPRSHSIGIARNCAPCEIVQPYRSERFLAGTCDCITTLKVDDVLDAVTAQERSVPRTADLEAQP